MINERVLIDEARKVDRKRTTKGKQMNRQERRAFQKEISKNKKTTGYYYLHTNGSLIFKSAFVVQMDPQYFDSPFVVAAWPVDPTSRSMGWRFILEALALGANIEDVSEIMEKSNLIKLTYFSLY